MIAAMADECRSEPIEEKENLLSLRSLGVDARRDLVEGSVDAARGMLWWGIEYLSMIVAVLVPILGITLGGIGVWLAIRRGRSKILPVMTVIVSVVVWIGTASPFGMLGVILDAIG